MESSEKCRCRNLFRPSGTSPAGVGLPVRARAAAVPPDAEIGSLPLPRANRTSLSPGACNSIQNADLSVTSTCFVRVTHPFHPLSGQRLICVGNRYNRYGTRLLLQVDEKTVCSVPRQWTDVVPLDPEVVMGGQRALFRVTDLIELARLVARLVRRDSGKASDGDVRLISPLS